MTVNIATKVLNIEGLDKAKGNTADNSIELLKDK